MGYITTPFNNQGPLIGVDPFTGMPLYAPAPGQNTDPSLYPRTTSTTGTTTGTGTTRGRQNTRGTSTRALPPEIAQQLAALIPSLVGSAGKAGDQTQGALGTAQQALSGLLAQPGMTPEEIAALMISPDQAEGIISQDLAPIFASGDAAKEELLNRSAARGNYAPGLNATIEEVARQTGRTAADAGVRARSDIEAQNRAAALAAANARIQGTRTGTDLSQRLLALLSGRELGLLGEAGGLLEGYPESTVSSEGESSQTGETSQTGTTTGQSTSGVLGAPGIPSPPGAPGVVGPGQTGGVMPKAPAPAPAPASPPPPAAPKNTSTAPAAGGIPGISTQIHGVEAAPAFNPLVGRAGPNPTPQPGLGQSATQTLAAMGPEAPRGPIETPNQGMLRRKNYGNLLPGAPASGFGGGIGI